MKRIKQPLPLAEECNGKLFYSIGLVGSPQMGYHTLGSYYTVADGLVYFVNKGTFQASGESLMQLVCECQCIGEFDPAAYYESKEHNLSFAQAKRMLGL